jgi:ADP-heptose:LPS heptosyltransferase
LAVLLRCAAVFVGNSSGPLHLAVMVGTPVVAFYPPIRACRPERWGPYGRWSDVLMSQQEECWRCRKSPTRVCDCMRAISVKAALEKIQEKL